MPVVPNVKYKYRILQEHTLLGVLIVLGETWGMAIKNVKTSKINNVSNSVLKLGSISKLWEIKSVALIQQFQDEKYILIFQKDYIK